MTCSCSRSTTDPTLELARRFVYQFLAIAASDPFSARWKRLRDPALQEAVRDAAEILRTTTPVSELAPGELPPQKLDLGLLISLLENAALDIESEYQQVFGLVMSKHCPPYETEYYPQTFPVFRSQMLADIAGFYRAFGLEPSRDRPERHDHLALELEFMAWLIARTDHARRAGDYGLEHVETCLEAQRHFFEKHLAWWVPAFARALRRRMDAIWGQEHPRTFYDELADALAALVSLERCLLGVPAVSQDLAAPRSTDDSEPGFDQCAASPGSLPVINSCASPCDVDG